jgi:hypothetical protein
MTPQEEQVIADLGLTMTAVFVPWNQSRNKSEKHPSLNWSVTLACKGRNFLTTDYMMGMAHCPSYKQGDMSVDQYTCIRMECNTGRRQLSVYGSGIGGRKILPPMDAVLASLCSDAYALDSSSFKEWADNYGMSADNKAAEATYHACLEIGLKLRNALGEDGLKRLNAVFRDY